jgi:signal transduction histidine kinase
MLYAGNTASLSDEALQLMKEVAEAFSTAYARYEDFNKLEEAKIQVDAALIELKATQAQLIQSEKMASLGELTAGIAHEIQNPLNFVNNFSEVNEELIAELQEELKAGNNTDVLSLATALDDNLKKILHHGKRADSIVKGMLQHSRTDTGKKEYTDINALADEYLRLSYHGLRAKHKTFTAIFETHFDPALKPIEIVPQEIGRVLLNLFNNAFYAVNEKKKTAEAGYDPTVSVSTQASEKQVIIKVKDNGHGIPANAIDKIFQPFFTTKPTGEGTGLGLSLSYDIITKGHGGEMTVATKEGIGTEFTILIPVKQTI